nr:ribosomal protein S11 [Hypnea sp.]
MLYKNKLLILSVVFTSNNILYTVTDLKGNILFWTSAGTQKVKNTKKITATSIILSLQKIKNIVIKYEIKYLFLKMNGFSKSKKTVLKYLKQFFVNIILVYEKINLAHNGCKNSKMRRL